MCKREGLIKALIEQEAGFVVGGHVNGLTDDGEDYTVPTLQEMIEETYDNVIHAKIVQIDTMLFAIKGDIRFVGKSTIVDWVTETVTKMYEEEGF